VSINPIIAQLDSDRKHTVGVSISIVGYLIF